MKTIIAIIQMKKLILILAILLIGLSACKNNKERLSPFLNVYDKETYNVEKDRYIDSIISTKPLSVKKDCAYNFGFCTYKIKYAELVFSVTHNLPIEYQQKESWDILCIKKDGSDILITSTCGVVEHMISPKTLDKIKAYCK